jgi:hypothetical protein
VGCIISHFILVFRYVPAAIEFPRNVANPGAGLNGSTEHKSRPVSQMTHHVSSTYGFNEMMMATSQQQLQQQQQQQQHTHHLHGHDHNSHYH